MKKEMSFNDYVYFSILFTILVLIILYILYIFIGQPPIFNCIIHENFGIFCPGCGCTRALISLFQGNIIKSLYYNPTILYSFIILSIYIFSNTVSKIFKKENSRFVLKYNPIYLYIGIFLLFGTCIIKNVLILYIT